MKKIFLLIGLLLLMSCSATKPKITTTIKKEHTKKQSNTKKKTNQGNANSEILEATSKIKVTPEIVKEYIAKFKYIAQENMRRDGIPASITLAQGILESGAGTGTLSRQANNHFGIKCHSGWTGKSVRHDDDALQECFRMYDLAEDSYKDHSYFLKSRSRYASLFLLPKSDYKSWASGLRKAGYATDVKYPEKLITLIEKYQLYLYDQEILGQNSNDDSNITQSTIQNYTVVKGDTLYSISKKFNTTVQDLKQKNNLIDNSISLGQSIIIK